MGAYFHHLSNYLFAGMLMSSFFSSAVAFASVQDTLRSYRIREITVTGSLTNASVQSSSPLQVLSSKSIEQLNVLQLSDAVKYFSGVTVKDYGGIGGLKTVSVRSLGANQTAVSYDGFVMTDAQTGQIDLSRFSLKDVSSVTLDNGQPDNIFQPARIFTASSVLAVKSQIPFFQPKMPVYGKLELTVGSFGMIQPYLLLNMQINKILSSSVNAEWLSATGNYPYLLHYGNRSSDSTSIEIRQNSDVKTLRLEGTLFARFNSFSGGYLKAYYYNSDRGLPGATIFYNAETSSKQRIGDRNFFMQGHYLNTSSERWKFQLNARFNHAFLHYFDPLWLNSQSKLDNHYLQEEYYSSASVLYRPFARFSISASVDGSVNTLRADLPAFSPPVRFSLLGFAGAKYQTESWLITASLLGTAVNEKTEAESTGNEYRHVSPYLSVSYKPFAYHDLRFRCFYKNMYQLPTFNDLYYPESGNRALKPETSRQMDFGLTYACSVDGWMPLLNFTLDGYHNDVEDKIVSFPNKNTFGWTTLNLGQVSITGFDLTAETEFRINKYVTLLAGTSYTYQRALDVTDPASVTYNNQIPYTPRVSGSGKLSAETPWLNVSYSLLWSGYRYTLFQNYAENRMPGYTDHSLSFYRSFAVSKHPVLIKIEILNLMNQNYQIVRYFPMPGRSFRLTGVLNF